MLDLVPIEDVIADLFEYQEISSDYKIHNLTY